jgi:hypothetical protein
VRLTDEIKEIGLCVIAGIAISAAVFGFKELVWFLQ